MPNLKTANAFSVSKMFYSCSSLTSLNLPYFDTINIGDYGLNSIFDGCTNLTLSIKREQCSNIIELIPNYITIIDL